MKRVSLRLDGEELMGVSYDVDEIKTDYDIITLLETMIMILEATVEEDPDIF